jgi:hypothetical protein
MTVSPIKRVNTCAFCGPGITHLIDPSIYPDDIIAKQDKSGKWKCGHCQDRDIKDMIVRGSPNSPRAKEIVAEHTVEVNRHNEAARRLNQISGHEAMKLKINRYSRSR